MKFKKIYVFIILALIATVFMVHYVYKDINLDFEDLIKKSIDNIPDLVLENLEFSREISGDLWTAKFPLAERHDGLIYLSSLDIRRKFPDGKVWYFGSARGIYDNENKSASLKGLLGTMETEMRVLNLESPEFTWSEGDDGFFFPQGLTIYDDEFILITPKASMDESGVLELEKGGSLRWTKPLN